MRLNSTALLFIALFFALPFATAQKAASPTSAAHAPKPKAETRGNAIELHRAWTIQSSCKVKATGEAVSKPGFATKGWHRTTVPNTVVGALVTDGTYPNPYYGMNLRSLPGMDYSSKSFFSDQDMPADSPYACSW